MYLFAATHDEVQQRNRTDEVRGKEQDVTSIIYTKPASSIESITGILTLIVSRLKYTPLMAFYDRGVAFENNTRASL